MNRTCPACDTYSGAPDLQVTVADLLALGHLMPPVATDMLRNLGPAATEALIRVWPGQELLVPKFPNANPAGARRWAQLEHVVGPQDMPALAAAYGGGVLRVPACKKLLDEKRARWIRQRFDEITATSSTGEPGLSRRSAVHEIVMALTLAHRGLTYRQVERAIDATDVTGEPAAPAPPPPQMTLPFPALA
jgi:hypothetical protein